MRRSAFGALQKAAIRPLASVYGAPPPPSPLRIPWAMNIHTESHKPESYSSLSSSPPPSSSPSPPPKTPNASDISDHEWNLRAGRAVHTLRTTLPAFFETGLVSGVDPSSSRRSETNNPESIYAPNIRLSYTPPSSLSLPAPFPKTLQVEGLPLYHASATFVRHTLSAFNTDLYVELLKLHVRSPGERSREIVIRTGVSGKSRISGASNEWDVLSTYSLSARTGLIDLHVVESIDPAPHVTFYDGLRAAIERLAGIDSAREGVRGCVSGRRMSPISIRERPGQEQERMD